MGINFEGDAADATRYTVFLSLEGEEAFLGNRGVRVCMCVRGRVLVLKKISRRHDAT